MSATLVTGPADASWTLVLAHGAGAPMDHPFMDAVAEGLGAAEVRVVRFEFPYMAKRRNDGRKRGPDTMPKLQQAFRDAVPSAISGRLAVGGKSMGGRVATHVAAELGAEAVVVFGYPFHPPGRPEKTRTEHLADLDVPTLILQGERDPFGTPTDVAAYDLPPSLRVGWIPDGDHGLKPRKSSGHTEEGNLALAVAEAADFLAALA